MLCEIKTTPQHTPTPTNQQKTTTDPPPPAAHGGKHGAAGGVVDGGPQTAHRAVLATAGWVRRGASGWVAWGGGWVGGWLPLLGKWMGVGCEHTSDRWPAARNAFDHPHTLTHKIYTIRFPGSAGPICERSQQQQRQRRQEGPSRLLLLLFFFMLRPPPGADRGTKQRKTNQRVDLHVHVKR